MSYLDQTQVITRTRRYQIREYRIQRLGFSICTHLGVEDFDLSVQFVGDTTMRRLNREFRGKDKTTDVLSFPQVVWPQPGRVKASTSQLRPSPVRGSGKDPSPILREPLGDLVISLAVAERNARMIGQPLDREVCFLLIHGILHLCGHDHMIPHEERVMLRCQKRLMTLLGDDTPKNALWRGCVQPIKRKST